MRTGDETPRQRTGRDWNLLDPIKGGGHAVVRRVLHAAGGAIGRNAATTVAINGEVIQNDQVEAQALALLGINEVQIDEMWADFVVENNRFPLVGYEPGWASKQQANMGWTMEIDIGPAQISGVEELALLSLRDGPRRVTFNCISWSDGGPAESGGLFELPRASAPPVGAEATRTQSLEAAGALSFLWSGVAEGEIESTKNAAESLHAARRNIEEALKEISIAHKVANEAWKGPRAEAADFKFVVEAELLWPLRDAVWRWETYTHDLVTAQREARKRDLKLRKDILSEVPALVIGGAVGIAIKSIMGAAKAWKAARVANLVRKAADDVNDFRKAQRGAFVATAANAARALGRFTATSATEGIKDFAGHAPADPGKAMDEWWKSFVYAGLISGGGGQVVGNFAKARGIDLDAPYGAAKGYGLGGVGAGGKALGTSDALLGGFVSSGAVAAAKEAVKKRAMKQLGLTEEAFDKKYGVPLDVALGSGGAAAAKSIDRSRERQEVPHPPSGVEGLVPMTEE
jgi:hypothetical protein